MKTKNVVPDVCYLVLAGIVGVLVGIVAGVVGGYGVMRMAGYDVADGETVKTIRQLKANVQRLGIPTR